MKCLAILPALALLSACGDTPEASFAKAKQQFAAHDYAAARVHLAAALGERPGDRAMLLLQAKALLALGDGEGAGVALDKLGAPQGETAELAAEAALLRQSPDKALAVLGALATPEAERLRALAALQQGRIAEAGALFDKAIAAGGNARVFADASRYRLMAGDVTGARAMADRAAQADPDGLDTLLVQAQLSLRGGDLAAALGHYANAAKGYPASLAALTGQAAVLGDLGRTAEMRKLVAEAQKRAPRDLTVIYLKARADAAEKKWAAVRDAVQPIDTTLPRDHPLRLVYAEALTELGQPAQAAALLRPIVAGGPGSRQAAILLASALLKSGDAAGALAVLRPVTAQPFATNEELALAADAAKRSGNADAASLARRAAAPAPQALGRELADADAAIRAGNWAGASEAYGRLAEKTDGRNVIVLNNLAYSQLMLGNVARANAIADKAMELAPENASVLDTKGWAIYKQGGNRAEALRLLRQAAAKAPDNRQIADHLAEAEAR